MGPHPLALQTENKRVVCLRTASVYRYESAAKSLSILEVDDCDGEMGEMDGAALEYNVTACVRRSDKSAHGCLVPPPSEACYANTKLMG